MSDVEFPLLGYRIDGMPKTIAQRTRRVYDRLSTVYPLSTFFFHSRAHRRVLKDSGIADGMCILEAATGSGEMFRRLVKANRRGTTLGMDLSPNMAARTLNRARHAFPGSSTHCHAVDARHMPYPDAAFDAVVCCYLLELLSGDDIVRTVSEFYRVLRPGAALSLVLIGQHTEAFNRVYRFLGSLVPAFWGRQVERKVPELIEARGFQIEADKVVRQTGYPSRVLVARK